VGRLEPELGRGTCSGPLTDCVASLRCAAAESVPGTVIAAICLLETRSVDEIVTRLTPAELEQVINIVGRCPRGYPPGAYDALKGHSATSSTQPRIGSGPERLHQRTSPATEGRRRWTPPRRFAGFGAKDLPGATERATANTQPTARNPYGITLDRAWTQWAAQHGVSETIAAALYLVSRDRKAEDIVVKLTLGEVERLIGIVQRWPDHFPPGALVALKNSRTTLPPELTAARTFADAGHTLSFARTNPGAERDPIRGSAQPCVALLCWDSRKGQESQ
jgi:hypothetical protein